MPFEKLTFREFLARFPDDDACLAHLMADRFGFQRICRKCKKYKSFHKVTQRRAYACSACGDQVFPCSGTIFEHSATPLQSWFYAMHLFANSRGRVSAREIEPALGVTYKTAWRIRWSIENLFKRAGSLDLGRADWDFVGSAPDLSQEEHSTSSPII